MSFLPDACLQRTTGTDQINRPPGLEQQIQEIKEAVELPLTHPELYEEMGIKPPKGTLLVCTALVVRSGR